MTLESNALQKLGDAEQKDQGVMKKTVSASVSYTSNGYDLTSEGENIVTNSTHNVVMHMAEINKPALNSFASNSKEYGNKTANLIRLNELNSSLNKGFLVPEFTGFSHKVILDIVEKILPSFPSMWQSFCADFQEEKNIGFSSKKSLDTIQQSLIKAFDDNNIFSKKLGLEYPIDLANKNLMVRSTGNEDTDELSNAGGNLSLQSLSDEISLSKSIGCVIASYFSSKSLEQRLKASDNIIEEPFIPVLLQELIGEDINDNQDPVSSGVAFVTNGKVTINAAVGHNELVVASKSTTDSFYVSPTNHIIYNTIRKKPLKIKPEIQDKKLELNIVENTSYEANKSSLSEKQVQELASYARFVEQEYCKPMDIEFVVTGDKFYIVQARPIRQNKHIEIASALNPELLVELDVQFKGQNITPDLKSAQKITSSEEVYIAHDIQEAHKYFLSNSGLKTIFIEKSAASNSHEAIELKAGGVIVLQMNDIQKIRELMQVVVEQPLIIDPQRSTVFQLKSGCSYNDDYVIHNGLFSSALPGSVYINNTTPFNQEVTPKDIVHVLPNISFPLGDIVAATKSRDTETAKNAMSQLFSLIFSKIDSLPSIPKDLNIWSKIKTDLKDLDQLNLNNLADSRSKISEIMQAVYLLRKSSDIISNNMFKQLMISATELLLIIDNIEQKPSATVLSQSQIYGEYIDIIKKFFGMILGDNIDDASIGNSLLQDISTAKEEKELNSYLANINIGSKEMDILKGALRLEKHFINDKTKQLWHEFAITICTQSPQDADKLNGVMSILTILNLIEKGCNILIANSLKTGLNSAEILTKISKELVSANENITPLMETKSGLLELKNKISDWQYPENFDKLLKLLHKVLVPFLNKQNELNSENIICQIHNNNSLFEFIEIIDLSTKNLISSSYYYNDSNIKAVNFSKILNTFFKIFDNLIPKDFGVAVELKSINGIIEHKLQSHGEFNESEFSVSPNYNGNKVFDVTTTPFTALAFDIKQCRSLHDFFTFMHQENISFATKNSSPLNKIMLNELPESLTTHCNLIVDAITSLESTLKFYGYECTPDLPFGGLHSGFIPKLSQIDISSSKILIGYHITLRQHGAGIQLEYNPDTDSTLVTFKTYGANEVCRWEHCELLTKLEIGLLQGIKFTSEPKSDFEKNVFSFQFSLDGLTGIQINKVFTAITEYVLLFSTATYANNDETTLTTLFDNKVILKLTEISHQNPKEYQNTISILNEMFNAKKDLIKLALDQLKEDEEEGDLEFEESPLIKNCTNILNYLYNLKSDTSKISHSVIDIKTAIIPPLPHDEESLFSKILGDSSPD
jgi:hypothetical protein